MSLLPLVFISFMHFGYICVPLIFQSFSGISAYAEGDILNAVVMHYIYFMLFALSFYHASKRQAAFPRIARKLLQFEPVFENAILSTLIVVLSTLITGYLSIFQDTTIYTMTTVGSHDPSSLIGIINSAVRRTHSYAWAALALITILMFRKDRRIWGTIAMLIFTLIWIFTFTKATRLAFLYPMLVMCCALAFQGYIRHAKLFIVASFVTLVIMAPFSRTLRNDRAVRSSHQAKFDVLDRFIDESTVVGSFVAGVESVTQRADLIQNTIEMVNYVHHTSDFVGIKPYEGLAVFLIPRSILPNKPIMCSANGKIDGLPSVILWKLVKGKRKIGSLTCFGATTMYWQFWWPGVIFGAVTVGYLLGRLVILLLGGGTAGRLLVIPLIINGTVAQAPMSLDEFLRSVLDLGFYIMLFLIIPITINKKCRIHVCEFKAGEHGRSSFGA